MLRLGKRWRKYLSNPPVEGPSHVLVPCSCAAPMGFGPSAGWAQALTDKVTMSLPADKRVRIDHEPPLSLPLWGSIEDDVWALEETAPGSPTEVSPFWLHKVEEGWKAAGIDVNEAKNVDAAAGGEVQGYYVHPRRHWVGVSLAKRRL
eukprot:10317197-Karenia_brevis.AAC.1